MPNRNQNKTPFIPLMKKTKQPNKTVVKTKGKNHEHSYTDSYPYVIHWLREYEAAKEKIFLEDITPEWIQEHLIVYLMEEYFSTEGIAEILNTITEILKRYPSKAPVASIVLQLALTTHPFKEN